ncbi:hypothetical protein K788_0000489 [Paraburkholderia caribensis MBA4]|uniref:Uncharacterized protein n=1 Tax=Paraburkholderia caribensis MBA4 TaxID=1323664 RepID=A0A0P0RIM0_9BURK|nr:hypothetical protein [Paraburkholderia caribensis]ALL68462.1 hypothetical protein K788_0000489 [Paraburkholderia caribensis MBA4]
MNLNNVIDNLKDPYDRKARTFPGLLTALPLLVPLLWIFGPKSPILTSLLGLVAGCGAIYALGSVARGRGKRLEERLLKRWGGMPTTLILRHRDDFLDSVSKKRYHDEIKAKLRIVVPTVDEERLDPVAADDVYKGATRHLRELTRGKSNALLLKENIAYGFHRNMLAMRPVGIFACVLGIAFGLLLSKSVTIHPFAFNVDNLLNPGAAGGMTLVVAVVLLLVWSHFNSDQVRRIGYVYAERLFESLKSLPTKRQPATEPKEESAAPTEKPPKKPSRKRAKPEETA